MLCLNVLLSSGCLYSNVKYPMDTNFEKTELGAKVGKSEMYSVFWMVAWGDAGTQAAVENGKLKIINHADQEFFTVFFGLYSKFTTILYGD